MYISPEITFGLFMLLQDALSLPLTNQDGSIDAFAFSPNQLLPLGEQRRSPGIPSHREKKSQSYSLPQFLVPHHQLHVIPLRRPVLHQNNNILVLTPTNVTTTQLVPILLPIHNHLAQRFVPVHQNHVVNVQNVYLQDLSVIPLHQAHLHEQQLQRARANEVEDEEPMNPYRMYYGGFGNGLYFGGHGAGHGFYAYG